MEAWRARLANARATFLDDDDDDEVTIFMALGQMEAAFEEETMPPSVIAGGSRRGKRKNIERARVEMDERMYLDYFSESPVYGPTLFRRGYRMRSSLFLTIMEKVCEQDSYFVQKRDACGLLGLSSHKKCTAALRMLALGVSADSMDDYCRTSESTAMECMKRFCKAIRSEFGEYHLRQPSRTDFEQQLQINSARGFPGMFGSIYCMHYEWKNCHVAWQGDYGDREGKRSIILEAIADQGLHIWHMFFGLPGSNNDINVLDRSSLIHNMVTGEGSHFTFEVNGQEYNRYYLLADGIYPQWSCFVQSIHNPCNEKRKHFAKKQEACRKDVERCFGVLQARFSIIRNPCRQWDMETIEDIMFACCILHNMILDDEHNVSGLENIVVGLECENVLMHRGLSFRDFLTQTTELESADLHYSLRGDLIEHLWTLKGTNA